MPGDLASVRAVLAVLKRERVPFGDAWAVAVPDEPPSVRDALDATRDGWRRAYERRTAERRRARLPAPIRLGD